MNLRLQSITVENFKGIRHFETPLNGVNLHLKGKNESGKTSLYDSFLWLLFGKNSAGETKFCIKPTTAPDGVEPIVTALFTVDGKPLELGKILAAKFAKDTGEFKESKAECSINGVKKAPREFEAFIAENICTEAQFRLLTNPRHFNETLDWKERRKVLFDVCKIATDMEIIAQNSTFSPLLAQLQTYGTADEYRKFLQESKKKVSEQINVLPIRIDEVYKQVDATLKIEEITADLTVARANLAQLQADFAQAENNSTATKISRLEDELKIIKNANSSYRNEQSLKQSTDKFSAKSAALTAVANAEREISQTSFELDTAIKRKKALISEQERLLACHAELQASSWQGDSVCPTCKRILSDEEIETTKGNFNEVKAKKLTEISAGMDALGAEIAGLTAKEDGFHYQLTSVKKRLEKAQAIADEVEKTAIAVSDLEDFAEKNALVSEQILALKAERYSSQDEAEARLKQNISFVTGQVIENERLLAKVAQNAELTMRISKLQAEQKRLAAEQGNTLKMLDLSDEFIRTKVHMVEKNINDKFKLARFKLFNEQVTDGKLSECCEVLANNSSDYSGINNAGKILSGFDIIKTLSAFYGVSVPLFVDNLDGLDSKSRQKLYGLADFAQLITLLVSDDENLTRE